MDKNIKKIYRSRKERILAGICGGIANYFEVDPTLVRIIFLFMVFAAGSGILTYLILIFLVPLEPEIKIKKVKK
jgi:phage shock protein C